MTPEPRGPSPWKNIVTCRYCSGKVKSPQLNRHFSGDCAGMPKLEPGQKICTRCQDPKPIEDFTKNAGLKHGKGHTCKTCNQEVMRNWTALHKKAPIRGVKRHGKFVLRPCEWCGEEFGGRQMHWHRHKCPNNPTRRRSIKEPDVLEVRITKAQRRVRDYNLKYTYGITIADYDRMLAEQKGVCAICHQPPSGNNRAEKSLHVDHDHATKEVRGLLCTRCNHLVGNCLESEEILATAARYLRRHQRVHLVK